MWIKEDSTWKDPPEINEKVAKEYLDEATCRRCHEASLLPGGEPILGLGNNFTDQWVGARGVSTMFQNPAISLTARFFSGVDPATLAVREKPDKALEPPEGDIAPVRVPPWWRVKDKNASFYIGSARGNRVTHMMLADLLEFAVEEQGKDQVANLKKLHDDTFVQVAAYIRHHTSAPKFEGFQPDYKVDKALAATGEKIFRAECAKCHDVKGFTLLVTTDDRDREGRVLGTDEALCSTPGNREIDAAWFNQSPFATELGGKAEVTRKCAYVAPPLSGIWAAAPYFHNGSVPTLEGVLNSKLRPKKWAYAEFGKPEKRDFDRDAVGWKVFTGDVRPRTQPKKTKPYVYDTILPGYSNQGHTYGDSLTRQGRKALIEYLKTL